MPIWELDSNTITVTHLNADTQTEVSKTYHRLYQVSHLHFSDSHCPDRFRRLVSKGKIIQYLDDMERKFSEVIAR